LQQDLLGSDVQKKRSMSIAEFGLNMPDHIRVFVSRADRSLRHFVVPGVVLCVSTLLASCTILPAAGPSSRAVVESAKREVDNHAVHDPQVIVRVARNAAFNVTADGEVANGIHLPLTAKGERLLDALASAGWVKQPVGTITVQVTRGDKVNAMSLEAVIKDPRQNIRLQAEDVVTLLFQPYSFTVLGAARNNQEIPFEGTGLNLSQALGRTGGLDDQRANPKGVFIFHFEDPAVFSGSGSPIATTQDGKAPGIYRINMCDPTTLFVAQSLSHQRQGCDLHFKRTVGRLPKVPAGGLAGHLSDCRDSDLEYFLSALI